MGYGDIVRELQVLNNNTAFAMRPPRPGYTPAHGWWLNMAPQTDERLKAIEMDRTGLNKFRGEATRTGPSAWAGLMNQQISEQEKAARGKLARDVAGRGAEARSMLAMRGGMDSGARERIARQGGRDYLDMTADLESEARKNRLQVGINDEQNRIQQLSMLPGMERDAVGFDLDKLKLWGQANQFDVANAVTEGRDQNRFNMDAYQQDMQSWAANQLANATERSGK